MFWGLIMEPQKRYSQVIKKAFHISMACLDISHSDDQPAQILCGYEGKNYLLCTLHKPDKLQCHLDLYFEEGHSVSFASNGKSLIHLTGYLTKEFEEENDGDSDDAEFEVMAKKKSRNADNPVKEPRVKKIKLDYLFNNINEESESDDTDFDIEKLLEEEDSGDESGEDEDSGDENEEQESVSLSEEDDDDEDEEEEEAEEEESDVEEEDDEAEEQVDLEKLIQNGVSKKEKKNKRKKVEDISSNELEPSTPTKKNKQPKEKHQLTPGPNAKKLEKPGSGNSEEKKSKDKAKKGNESKSPTPKRRVMANGVIVEDLKVGQGNVASDGKFLHVYYEGRLLNNKVFDKTSKGSGFGFRLGKGEVIKGWDIGVKGMQVGGKRRITCPPQMAYGAKGSPPTIPPNSTLVFDVELRKVK